MSDEGTTKIKCAGYVRVSSRGQVDGESLTTQRTSIEQFAKSQGWELTQIYADEGISGGSMKKRHALQQCLRDGQIGRFTVLIVPKLSRFGRNARELLENHEQLKQAGIQLRSLSEGIDFSSRYGEAMLGMLAVIAQLDRDIIRETMLENRVAIGRKGAPTSGKLPHARTFNKATGEWGLDEIKASKIRQAAEDYLNGESLQDIADKIRMPYQTLLKALRETSGDKWTVDFDGEEPIHYTIPRLLPVDIERRVKERLAFKRTYNRSDITEKYLLTGFLICEECGHALTGQMQKVSDKRYRYYRHKSEGCNAITSINADKLDDAVMRTIFDKTSDIPSFEKAIQESLPDENKIKELEQKIATLKRELAQIQRQMENLVDAVLTGTLSKDTVRSKEQELLERQNELQEAILEAEANLSSMPDPQTVKQEAERIRLLLIDRYRGMERLMEMTFEEKRSLLHWLFDGKDEIGSRYGIYITTRGRGRNMEIDYFMYGQLVGIRTLKGDDIDYFDDDQYAEVDKSNYKTKVLAAKKRPAIFGTGDKSSYFCAG